MVTSLPPTENRRLNGDEQDQVLDRASELVELRYRAQSLAAHDDLLDAAVHATLTRDAPSPKAYGASRELLTHWGTWDDVRQATQEDLAAQLANSGLTRRRASRVKQLLEKVHADTNEHGWRGTTLNWVHQAAPRDDPDAGAGAPNDTAAYLATLPGITRAEAARIARDAEITGSLYEDPRAVRVLRRMGINTPDQTAARPVGSTRAQRHLADDQPSLPTLGQTEGHLPTLPRARSAEALRQNLVHHTRATCHTKKPLCTQCPLISFCPTGRSSHIGDGRPVAVEAFAGGGGLGEGFSQADFDVAIAVELDRDAAQTYRLNHPGTVVVEADARTVTGEELTFLAPRAANAVALAAGPPCQGYSAAGRRKADDARNNLYTAVVSLAKQLKPRFVVIENVPGMRRVDGESYVEAVLDALEAAGYNASEHLLRACDYGVPQLRRRMIFLAQLAEDGDAPEPPKPTHCADSMKCKHGRSKAGTCVLPPVPTVLATLEANGLPELEAGQDAEFLPLGDGQQPVTNASTMAHSAEVIAKIAAITPGAGPISYRRLHPGLARTIVAGHRALPVHPTLDRTISVREAARIQGFDDGHVFAGPRSKQPLQVANAVPPALGFAIAAQLRSLMKQDLH